MKLAIIMPPIHPMPPVNGAGLERMIDIFLHANEQAADPIEITVFSRSDSRAAELADSFLHSTYVYLDVTRSEPRSNRVKCWFAERFGGEAMRFDYCRELKKALRKSEFDEILLADCFEYATAVAKTTRKLPLLYARGIFFGEEHHHAAKKFRYISRFIFSSDFLKNKAIKAGVPEKRSAILRDCVDTAMFDAERFTSIRAEKRAKYGLSDDDILLVFVGRVVPDKGVIELVKAVAQSSWSRSKLKLLIVGSAQLGEDVRDEYREMIENAAPEGKIIFIGSVKPTSTARFIARADIAVVPSVGDETTGLAVLEPMSIGIPIITSDSGALSEYSAKAGDGCRIVKRGLGYVTLLAKAIDSTAERLANDPQWREKVSSELREAARDYDSSRFYDRFREQIGDK